MPAITLGNISNIGGQTVLTGGQTGLDIEGLVQSLSDAKRLPAVRLEEDVEQYSAEIEAIGTLQTIAQSFRDAANFLRKPTGVGNEAEDVFAYRASSVSSNTAVAGETYFTATAAAGATLSSYDITIDQIATKQVRVTNTFALADLDTQAVGGGGPFNAGNLLLGPALTSITLDDGDTMNEVLAKINAVKDTSGVEASTIKVSDGNYRITFKANTTGTDQNFDFDANNFGLLNTGFFSEVDGTDSLITIDGTQVTRQTNTISDVVDDITLQISQVSPLGTTLSLGVNADTEVARNAITNFVTAYNDFRVFAAQQNELNTDLEPTEAAILSSNATLTTMINSIGIEISAAVSGLTDGDPNKIEDIGISFTDYPGDEETPFTRNILQITDADLDTALAANFDAVASIFQFQFTSDNTDFAVFSHSNTLNTTEIEFNIDQTNGIYEATFDNGTGSQTITLTANAVTGGGVSLTADSESDLSGLVVLYSNTDDTTVTMNLTQGIADRLYNYLDGALDEDEGLLSTEVASLTERTDKTGEDIVRIDEQVEAYRDVLLQRFSALESALASVNTILQLLDAQAAAREA